MIISDTCSSEANAYPDVNAKLATGLDLKCSLVSSSYLRKAKDTISIKRDDGGEPLQMSFQRTIRVLDNQVASELPPSLGTFPLYPTALYQEKMPSQMAAKGGLFFPMYRKFSFPVDMTSFLMEG